MIKFLSAFFALLPFFAQAGQTPSDTSRLHHIAVFAPLYLDSAFDVTNNWRLGKTVPRYVTSGLDFYQGVLMALDSLDQEGLPLNVAVYDTRSRSGAVNQLVSRQELRGIDLIIGAVSGGEYLQLADVAKQENIPFVSATYPNDGGVTANPNVIVVNSKLNTHLQSLYNFVLRTMGTQKLVLFRRKNSQDDRVVDVIKQLNTSASGGVLNIKIVTLEENFIAADIATHLDSTRQNAVISGSLDESFGYTLTSQCATLLSSYPITVVGMPTWENIPSFNRTELRSLPIVYSTTFYNAGVDAWSTHFSKSFARQSYTKPTDMAFRGFELTYYFAKLLSRYDSTLTQHLADKSNRVLTDFDFRPIFWSKTSASPDYYENKRIYIVRRQNATITKLN